MTDKKLRRELKALRKQFFIVVRVLVRPFGRKQLLFCCEQHREGYWLCGRCCAALPSPKVGTRCAGCGARVVAKIVCFDSRGYDEAVEHLIRQEAMRTYGTPRMTYRSRRILDRAAHLTSR